MRWLPSKSIARAYSIGCAAVHAISSGRHNFVGSDSDIRATFINRNSNKEAAKIRGFTIIELLFVLIVATILLSVAIPRIRLLTQERGVREAARIVASKFSIASEQARANGTAGVLIRRNPNFVDGAYWFAATEIGVLRAVPNFVGDQSYEKGLQPPLGATKTSSTEVEIPIPIEFREQSPIKPGDWISFNHTPAQYEITETNSGNSITDASLPILKLKLEVKEESFPQLPPKLDDAPYVIHRQPKLRRSSLQQLPSQYLIDLRFSGYDNVVPVFDRSVEVGDTAFENYDIVFLFNRSGEIEKVYFHEVDQRNRRTGVVASHRPNSAIHLLVAQTANSYNTSPLADALSLWVKIGPNTGSAIVSYIDPQRENRVSHTEHGDITRSRGITHIEARH